jgi:single-stranded DNA-binding protein
VCKHRRQHDAVPILDGRHRHPAARQELRPSRTPSRPSTGSTLESGASTDQRSRDVWPSQAEHLADSLAKGDRVMVTGRLRQRSWETPEGDKRSVTEIEADEVGASLKFATAKVERATERATGDRSQGRERQAERGGEFSDQPPF